LINLLKLLNKDKPQLREFDPNTIQRIKEGMYLVKIISETEVTARKCDYYAGNCVDQQVADAFRRESKKLVKAAHALQEYYESMTKE
jgi:acetoacetate decarboxylase